MYYQRGSEWRKWDLHIHSKYSYEERAKLEIQEIFEKAIENDISVIAITDHSNVIALDEIWRIWEYEKCKNSKRKGYYYKELINFFPGVELKANCGKHGVHFIALFPKEIYIQGIDQPKRVDKRFIEESFLAKINCAKSDIERAGNGDYKRGLFEISVDLKLAADKAHELGGIIVVHNGRKDHSFDEEISHASRNADEYELLNTLGDEKKKLMKNYVDICEFPNWNKYHLKEKEFYLKEFKKPSIVGSDSHEKYLGNKYTWIKADPTFDGLKQVLNEPKDRIFFGEKPFILEKVQNNKTKYIDYIKINKKEDSTLEEIWFENIEIPLNPELVAIIGNKGNGKSALADIIGLTGNAKVKEFSFLNENKFKKLPECKADGFKSEIIWCSGDHDQVVLSDLPKEYSKEKVKYIPQSYLEKICNVEEKEVFEEELKKVIFSHIPDEDRLGCESLDELIDYKTEGINERIRNIQNIISDINKEIIGLEKKRTEDNIRKIESLLKEKQKELEAHNNIKPIEVKKPEEDIETKEKLVEIKNKLNENREILKNVDEEINKKEEMIAKLKLDLAKIGKIKEKINNFQAQYLQFKEGINKDLEELNVNINELVTLKINIEKLNNLEHNFNKKLDDINTLLNGEELESKCSDGLYKKKEKIKKIIDELSSNLTEPQRKYEEYLTKLSSWNKRKEELEEEINKSKDKLVYINEKLEYDLKEKENRRLEEFKKLFTTKIKILEIYKSIYEPVRDFIKSHNTSKPEYKVSFDVSLDLKEEYFMNHFFSLINQVSKGSFRGINEGKKKMKDIIMHSNFFSEELVIKFIEAIDENLKWDKRNGKSEKANIFSQTKEPVELYNFLFHINYLDPFYKLKLGDKDLSELSPGERGALLLIFYLLIDKDEIPLIIDQPEENLDNESIFKLLVPYIKEAKMNRQIIIVTHNPNLAVVCDAEQIIHAAIDKTKNKNKVKYLSGSIENREINKRIVDILEGTKPAFSNRKSKYFH